MAYNLQSLIQILEQVLHPDEKQFVFGPKTKTQLSSLLEKAALLKTNLEKHTPATIRRIPGLETHITDVVHQAEDLIESRLVDILKSQAAKLTISPVKLQQAVDGSHMEEQHTVSASKSKGVKVRSWLRTSFTGCCIAVEKRTPDLMHQGPRDKESLRESGIADKVVSKPQGQILNLISQGDLQQVIDELDSAMDKLTKIEDQTPNISSSTASFSAGPDPENFVVGLGEDSEQLKERLIFGQSNLEVIPIVGMGGIGKTTLARHLYNDQLIIRHFDRCAWVAISQEYDVKVVLFVLVDSLTDIGREELLKKEKHELQNLLHKTLFGRRYLIVLDDVWSTNIWDEIGRFFPDNNSGSRILITTRDMDVANYTNAGSSAHEMHLLNESESWKMLCTKVFGDENCPRELEEIGRKTARNCRGLPLALQVIGGLLLEAPKSEELWEHIGNDVSSAVARDDQHFSKILSLSYDHLPNHLRPCFLYLGGFPEDYEIKASRLIRLWVAEGFLQPIANRTLEEAAEEYLKALVDRSLILVDKKHYNGQVRSYVIHDMLRDLSMRKASDEKFRYVIKKNLENSTVCPLDRMRRTNIEVLPSVCFCSTKVKPMPFVRSVVSCSIKNMGNPLALPFELLRVLDIIAFEFFYFPQQILQLVNIRYLAIQVVLPSLPSSLCRLWNLQTLLILPEYTTEFRIPFRIFGLPQIRHILIKGVQPKYMGGCYREEFVAGKLQTLSGVSAAVFRDSNFTKAIPNLRTLGVNFQDFEVVDLSSLHKLESLKCCWYRRVSSAICLSCLTLPSSLKKLTLRNCTVPISFMSYVGALPYLEVLRLERCYLVDEEMKDAQVWEPTQEEFPSLEYLLLDIVDIVQWVASDMHFPSLQHLVIRGCSELEEIPQEIGGIPTLEMIELYNCSSVVVDSARQIEEEQHDMGNSTLQLHIHEE